MNYKRRTINGFTLIELVVAIGILAMVLVFAGVIFKVSIEAHRTSTANAEIMQKLRAITDQLNADFEGLRKDAPLLIWFEQDDSSEDPNRFDQIMFFADGDFQSTQLYESDYPADLPYKEEDKMVRGNIARIFYGQAQVYSEKESDFVEPQDQYIENDQDDPTDDPVLNIRKRTLARRQHILTADDDFPDWPDADMSDFDEKDGTIYNNDSYEHDSLSLSEWKIVDDYTTVTDACFKNRPEIDITNLQDLSMPQGLHMLLCEGVGSFAIQWAYWDEDDDVFYWFPSDDVDGDSHFVSNGNEFGVYFNIPGSIPGDWDTVDELDGNDDFKIFPKALKFTFTLYDSKGILQGGRPFTHIVYLGD